MSNVEGDMDKPVTKRELHEALDLWSGALEARLEARFETKFATKLELIEWGQRLSAELQMWGHTLSAELKQHADTWGHRLSAELTQHSNRVLDETRKIVSVVDEKYSDLPGRVAALETGAAPPPKRQRRR
ncbi:MAG TPA: hypothetical protein VIV11_41040 [Kofleriaceae bacterium]